MVTFKQVADSFDGMTQAAGNFEKEYLKSNIGLESFFEKFNQSNLSAVKHRKYLKEGAKFNAVGEIDKAKFYRELAESSGSKAIDGYNEATPIANTLESAINRMLGANDLFNYVKDGKFEVAVDQILENSIKPYLLQSNLPPYQVSYMWRDIIKFLNDFKTYVALNDGKLIPMPPLKPAIDDLNNVDYKDQNWDYADKARVSESGEKKEPIPEWKETIVKVGRWVAVAVCVALAIFTCQWEAVFELVQKWMEFEETIREFCGWVNA